MPGLVAVAYKNVSGFVVPPYGVIQFTGTPETTATGDIVLLATRPGLGDGPYFVDDGGGASVSGATQYGRAFRLVEGTSWVSFSGSAPSAWEEVGPTDGSFQMSSSGSGFYFTGQYEASYSRALVLFKSSPGTVPYIVTQVDGSLTQAIVRDVILAFTPNPSYPTFKAQPYLGSFISLAAIDHSKDVDVSSFCLTGALFTGQVFMCVVGPTKMAIGGDCARFRGEVIAAIGSNYSVEIYYDAATTPSIINTVTLIASNETGITLAAGMSVVVDLINQAGSPSGVPNVRWRISEYECT